MKTKKPIVIFEKRNIALLLFFIVFLINSANSQTSFCKGWKEGFKEGYCYGDYGCIAPVTPPCAIPNIGANNYRGGYNQGFVSGKKLKQKNTETNSSGSAYSQLNPIENNNIGNLAESYNRNETKSQDAVRYETDAKQAQFDAFQTAMKYASKAFEREDYDDCIWYYEQSKNYGFHDNRFDFAVGVSHFVLWQKSGKTEHKKKSIQMLQLAIKRGNKDATGVLEEIKNM